jgi:DNA-binding beta-propeller fold protein YncE
MKSSALAILPALCVTALATAESADLLVVEKKNNSVGFYASTGQRVGGVPVGETPHEVTLSRDGRYAYVSDNGVLWMDYDGPGGNTISIVDLQLRRRVGILPLGGFHRPHGIGPDPRSSRALVTAENPDRLVLVDLDARAVIRDFDNGGVDPHMVTFGPDGWGYVSNTASATVGAVHVVTGELRLIEVGKGPQGSLLSRDGTKLWVTCRDEGRIDVIDTASKSVIGSIPTGAGVNRVVATDDEGLLVYSLQTGEAVGIADPHAMKELAQIPLGGAPLSISLSKDDRHAFAGVQDEDQIWIVSVRDRKVVQVIDTPLGMGPDPVVEIGTYRPSRARP